MKPRWFQRNLQAALRILPVTVLTGARHTGNTTLTRVMEPTWTYFSLDDVGILDQAERNPDSLLVTRPIILDEVQRAPQILLAVKRAVDSDRRAGGFPSDWFCQYSGVSETQNVADEGSGVARRQSTSSRRGRSGAVLGMDGPKIIMH